MPVNPRERNRYPSDKKLSGTQCRPGQFHKTEDFVSEGIRTRIPHLLGPDIAAVTGMLISP